LAATCVAGGLLGIASGAQASLFTGETLDAVADGVAWAVLALVPIIGITVFWLVHVLPEKIAHRRHHPQADAIHTLCLLSLAFGGLLWPIAWLWAYTKPVAYKMAYGTEKHDSYFDEHGARARSGDLVDDEIAALRHELDTRAARGPLPPHLAKLREDIAAMGTEAQARAAPELERGGA
jgi:hypothetical protein